MRAKYPFHNIVCNIFFWEYHVSLFIDNVISQDTYKYTYSYDDKTKETIQTAMLTTEYADTVETTDVGTQIFNEAGFMTSFSKSNEAWSRLTYLPDNRILSYRSSPNSYFKTYEYKPNGSVVVRLATDFDEEKDNLDDLTRLPRLSVMTFNKFGLMESYQFFEKGVLTESQSFKFKYKHYFFSRKIKSVTQFSDKELMQKWEFRKDGTFERITEYYSDDNYRMDTFDEKNRNIEIVYKKNKEKTTTVYDDEKNIQKVYGNGKLVNTLYTDKYGNPIEEGITYEYFE